MTQTKTPYGISGDAGLGMTYKMTAALAKPPIVIPNVYTRTNSVHAALIAMAVAKKLMNAAGNDDNQTITVLLDDTEETVRLEKMGVRKRFIA